MIKEMSHVILDLYNVRMELLNVTKKIKEPLNVTKILSNVILELYNVMMKLLNVRKKKKNY